MNPKITYYKIVGRGRTLDDPSGIARRVEWDGNIEDESLRADLTWGFTSAISEWERGEELSRDLIEVDEEEAQAIIERFRQKWSSQA